MGATAPYFQRWITRIDPDCGRTRVATASLCEPNQVDGNLLSVFQNRRGRACKRGCFLPRHFVALSPTTQGIRAARSAPDSRRGCPEGRVKRRIRPGDVRHPCGVFGMVTMRRVGQGIHDLLMDWESPESSSGPGRRTVVVRWPPTTDPAIIMAVTAVRTLAGEQVVFMVLLVIERCSTLASPTTRRGEPSPWCLPHIRALSTPQKFVSAATGCLNCSNHGPQGNCHAYLMRRSQSDFWTGYR